ncbi:MAG: HD domain-containing protein [Chloroflexi bacterium]|nr:HD domain-containing protein [Chloroflexota bacterium]
MSSPEPAHPKVRLAEVIAALSLATDLGMGQPMEHALRRCLLAVRIGEALGVSEGELRAVYYVALVCSVGCTVKLKEFTPWFSDEIAAAREAAMVDPSGIAGATRFLISHVGKGDPLLGRARKVVGVLAVAKREAHRSSVACHEICTTFGDLLGFDPPIRAALGQMHEHWDGSGEPAHLKGEEKALASRIAHLAGDAVLFHRAGGVDAAAGVVRQRAGRVYDPQIAQLFCQRAPKLLAEAEGDSVWDAVLAAEPAPHQWLDDGQLDKIARAMAYFADVKSPYTLSHSTGVAGLAEGAAHKLSLPSADVATVRRAALLHDLGRIGVPVGIWDKAGPLAPAEWERVRMHPYLTERVLARSSSLCSLGALASLHHERLDGSGYHRGVSASLIPMAARILAVADFFHTKVEPRPHRPALAPDAAAEETRQQVQAGRLDRDAASAVLSVAGQPTLPHRGNMPAGLTDREVEVLRLLAGGRSIREMAQILYLSPKTVDSHVQHIYDKAGVSTRAAATLFAMRHDLVGGTRP